MNISLVSVYLEITKNDMHIKFIWYSYRLRIFPPLILVNDQTVGKRALISLNWARCRSSVLIFFFPFFFSFVQEYPAIDHLPPPPGATTGVTTWITRLHTFGADFWATKSPSGWIRKDFFTASPAESSCSPVGAAPWNGQTGGGSEGAQDFYALKKHGSRQTCFLFISAE